MRRCSHKSSRAGTWLWCAALVLLAACSNGGVDATKHYGAGSSVTHDLAEALAPIDSMFNAIPERLRADSGTVRADSLALALRTEILERIRSIDLLVDSAFQLAIWPDGAIGYFRRVRSGRAGERADSADVAKADSVLAILDAHGVFALRDEGDTYCGVSVRRLLASVSPYVTDATRESLQMDALEESRPAIRHEVVLIPWDSLAERLAMADRWLAKYPGGVPAPQVRARRALFRETYLTGTANTPAFIGTPPTLDPELRRSYERFANSRPRSASKTVVRAYLGILSENGFRRTQAADAFVSRIAGTP